MEENLEELLTATGPRQMTGMSKAPAEELNLFTSNSAIWGFYCVCSSLSTTKVLGVWLERTDRISDFSNSLISCWTKEPLIHTQNKYILMAFETGSKLNKCSCNTALIQLHCWSHWMKNIALPTPYETNLHLLYIHHKLTLYLVFLSFMGELQHSLKMCKLQIYPRDYQSINHFMAATQVRCRQRLPILVYVLPLSSN